MNRVKRPYAQHFIVLILAITWMLFSSCFNTYDVGGYTSSEKPPKIIPDYSDLVIPPNIAPMHFLVQDPGKKYLVKIYTDSNEVIRIQSRSPKIQIPQKEWRMLLDQHKGAVLYIDIFVYTSEGKWIKYNRISNRIAEEPIDRYLVYRFLRPNYTVQKEIMIRQRDLESFDESLVMTTKTISACINCHSFNNHNPSEMLFHIRWGSAAGMILAQDGRISKIDTRTEFNQSPGAYPSWHPDGHKVALSVNKVFQFFHATKDSRDVIDFSSDLIIYDTRSNTVSIDPKISSPLYMETFPNWSPDGNYLYFCRAPQLPPDFDLEKDYQTIKYDLMRVPYFPETEIWGEPETLVSAAQIDMSCSLPRVSPDGRYLLFTAAEYGNFPIFHSSSDLYLMNLDTKYIQRSCANSSAPEGYHCWSSNGRWIVFTSKRDNGVYTRLYFSYVDEKGTIYQPFILPQKDPEDNQLIVRSFSVPEFITKSVPFSAQEFIDAALDPANEKEASLDPETAILPKAPVDSNRTIMDYP